MTDSAAVDSVVSPLLRKQPSEEEIRRRVKMARDYAGLSVTALAARLKSVGGLSESTLRKIESGDRPARGMELREIAEACGLPHGFFLVDFDVIEPLVKMWPGPELVQNLAIAPADLIEMAMSLLRAQLDAMQHSRRVQVGDNNLALMLGAEGLDLLGSPIAVPEQDRGRIRAGARQLIAQATRDLEERYAQRLQSLEEQVESLLDNLDAEADSERDPTLLYARNSDDSPWHWVASCSQYPANAEQTHRGRPKDGELCNECRQHEIAARQNAARAERLERLEREAAERQAATG